MVKGKVNGNLGFTVSYSMAKDSTNKPAAWTLLSWLTGKAGHDAVDVEGARAAVAHGREGDRRPAGVPRRRRRSRTAGASPTSPPTYTIMNNDLQAVINGSMTTSQMLSDVAKSLKG